MEAETPETNGGDNTFFLPEKVAKEVADAEIKAWLDWRRVMPAQREAYKGHIEILAEAIQYGMLVLEDNAFTQKLHFPITPPKKGTEEIEATTGLSYMKRVTTLDLIKPLQDVKSDDGDARIVAYIACMTKQAKQIVKLLDPADKRVADSIVVFFLG